MTEITELFTRGGVARKANTTVNGKPALIQRKTCTRCGGEGGSQAWAHTGYTCFQCGGSGTTGTEMIKLYTAEQVEKMNASQAKRDAKKAEKAEAARKAQQAAVEARLGAFRAEHGALLDRAEKYRDKSEFIADVIGKAWERAEITTGQVDALTKSVETFEAREAKEAAAQPIPGEGRMEIVGEVVSVKGKDTPYGYVLKMLVIADGGWKVYGTVPRAIEGVDRGARVRFTAAVEKSQDDPKFGFFSRPTNALVV